MKLVHISTIFLAVASFTAAAPTGQISAEPLDLNTTSLLTASPTKLISEALADLTTPLAPRSTPLLGGCNSTVCTLGSSRNQCKFDVLVLWYHYRIRMPIHLAPNQCEAFKHAIPAVTRFKCLHDGFGGQWIKFDTWLFTKPSKIEKELRMVLKWDMKCSWMHKGSH